VDSLVFLSAHNQGVDPHLVPKEDAGVDAVSLGVWDC
jgi:hypothetical protein